MILLLLNNINFCFQTSKKISIYNIQKLNYPQVKTRINLVERHIGELLREYGFDYEVLYTYLDNKQNIVKVEDHWDVYPEKIPAPFFDTVIQWLADVHDIEIFVVPIGNITTPRFGYTFLVYTIEHDSTPLNSEVGFKTYADAQYGGILYALNYYLKGIEDVTKFDQQYLDKTIKS